MRRGLQQERIQSVQNGGLLSRRDFFSSEAKEKIQRWIKHNILASLRIAAQPSTVPGTREELHESLSERINELFYYF